MSAKALLDVSSVLLDPDFAVTVTVHRRPQEITTHGRVETPDVEVIENVIVVITTASPNDLDRLDDAQRMGKNYSCITKFRLRGPSKVGDQQFQPDVVIYEGSEMVVKNVENNTRYGAGFIQAIIGSMDIIDEAPEGDGTEGVQPGE